MNCSLMRYLAFILLLLSLRAPLFAQDTTVVSLAQADSLFISNNLLLLAQRYQVDASKALIKQAKIWDNPSIATEWNLYNPDKDKFFDVGRNGQKIFSVEQVVYLAGKRNKKIELAKNAAQLSELEFYELMRTLKLELRSNFFTIYFNSLTINKYNQQLALLQTIIDALQTQNDKGNIPLKEVLRLKALYYELNNNRTDLVSQMYDAQHRMQTLLQTKKFIRPVFSDEEQLPYNIDTFSTSVLLSRALNNRPDLKLAEGLSKQADLNYILQKRSAYPDMRIGGVYDQAGSYVNNYSGVTLGFDLPLWNRNQGNIRYSKAMAKSAQLELQNKNMDVENEVMASYQKLWQTEQEYRKIDNDFTKKLDFLSEGYISNFQKRNISLIEFVDFIETYNQSILQFNKLKENRVRSYEELSYTVGEELFRK